ncbi:hypothetical protein MA16_Dca004845 [Dendrobium catenatum]|uniref:Uncharacterized protein n=1 Tax=Dendrobium catenatum TaxID=906689 RepID=A0A2I0WG56_9ASPA|nr:hypothetical protein MA16_Dca004845 [Dendrobium catenatum]
MHLEELYLNFASHSSAHGGLPIGDASPIDNRPSLPHPSAPETVTTIIVSSSNKKRGPNRGVALEEHYRTKDNNFRIIDYGISSLQLIYYLQELKLADCGPKVTDCGAQNCQNLMEIRLIGCEQIIGNGIRSFSGHQSLEELVLDSFYNVSIDDIVHVVLGCLYLSHLRLHRALKCWMPSSTQEQLTKLCDLFFLTLLLVDNNFRILLQELKLADCGPKVTDCGAQNCQNLMEIRLIGCEQITGNGIRSFSGQQSLEDLVLDSFCNVSFDDIVHVVLGCLSLSHLRLHRALKCWMPSSTQEQLS